jgi:hypothetical protein
MATDSTTGKGFLHIRAHKGKPFYEARWRELGRIQRRRRLGPAWVELDPAGLWSPARQGPSGIPRRAQCLPADRQSDRRGAEVAPPPGRPQPLFPRPSMLGSPICYEISGVKISILQSSKTAPHFSTRPIADLSARANGTQNAIGTTYIRCVEAPVVVAEVRASSDNRSVCASALGGLALHCSDECECCGTLSAIGLWPVR